MGAHRGISFVESEKLEIPLKTHPREKILTFAWVNIFSSDFFCWKDTALKKAFEGFWYFATRWRVFDRLEIKVKKSQNTPKSAKSTYKGDLGLKPKSCSQDFFWLPNETSDHRTIPNKVLCPACSALCWYTQLKIVDLTQKLHFFQLWRFFKSRIPTKNFQISQSP